MHGDSVSSGVGTAETGEYLNQIRNMGKNHELPFKHDEIVLVSTGDGTTSQGEFWESMTTACVNKLPVLFVVEDNGYAISVPTAVQTPEGSISKALKNFPGLKIIEVNGNCPIESYAAAEKQKLTFEVKKGRRLFTLMLLVLTAIR